MAVTKILAKNHRLDVLINYATNPDKTDEQVLTAYQNCDPGRAAQQMMDTKRALGKTGGVYYVLDSGSGLVDALDLQAWTITQEEAEGEPLVVFRLWEDCELALYEGGLAYAWNGYASSDTTGAVWYTIPEDTAQTVASLLKTDGQIETSPGVRF